MALFGGGGSGMDITCAGIYVRLRQNARGATGLPSYQKISMGPRNARALAHLSVESATLTLHLDHARTGRGVPPAVWRPCVDPLTVRFLESVQTYAGFVTGATYHTAPRGRAGSKLLTPTQVARSAKVAAVSIQFQCVDAWARGCSCAYIALGCQWLPGPAA